MYKTVWLMRRNPSLTREQFIDHYETMHSKVVKDMPGLVKYFRRYPVQMDNLADASGQATLGFDVIMELWFEDQESHDAAFAHLARTPRPDVVADTERTFDTMGDNWCTTGVVGVEHETDLCSPTFESTYERGMSAAVAE